ncbi:hypothetical protein EVAR_66626_1 [Eumeta japonica]|uniref:Uncharacterized protein n=1 Tax=Eumeta variegata TaxID=151549 RepID=A0A4C1ZS93_EUMVA|nr:hypothetical protein EVAR_66626_1 [Eumeta japonica]
MCLVYHPELFNLNRLCRKIKKKGTLDASVTHTQPLRTRHGSLLKRHVIILKRGIIPEIVIHKVCANPIGYCSEGSAVSTLLRNSCKKITPEVAPHASGPGKSVNYSNGFTRKKREPCDDLNIYLINSSRMSLPIKPFDDATTRLFNVDLEPNDL